MALNFEQQRLMIVKRQEHELSTMFQRLVTYIQGLLHRNSVRGVVPINRSDAIRREVGREVMKIMVGSPSQSGHIEPYTITNGIVTPNSDYFKIVWSNVYAITRIAVSQHAAIIQQSLSNAPDVVKALKAARRNPFAAKKRIAEIGGGGDDLAPNPLANYDPLHEWLDPSNARLSDNIWDSTTEGRRKLDLYLKDSIAQGMSARDMAADLEQFLVPGRNLIRTNKPYGTNASFDAMRLARTELTSAFTRASSASAQLNPFVETYDLVLSGSHADEDICNDVADAGPYDKGDDSGRPPDATHPMCCMPGQLVETIRGSVPIEEITEGDYVLTHRQQYCKVLEAWSINYQGALYRISAGKKTIELTPEHPVKIWGGNWKQAKDLESSDELTFIKASFNGWDSSAEGCPITDVAICEYMGRVYNMTVDTDNSYTVNGIAVHNCLCHIRWNRSATPKADIIARLRSQVATARDEARVGADADTLALVDAIGPMQIEAFSKLLMNPAKPQPRTP